MATNEEVRTCVTSTQLELVGLPFVFSPNGASAVTTSATAHGRSIASVVRASAGVFTVTLKNKWAKFHGVDLNLQSNAVVDIVPQHTGAETVTTSSTAPAFTITCHAAGVATDVAAHANTKIRGIVWVSRLKTVTG